MTVSSKGYNWQKHPQPWAAPYVKASPNLLVLLAYLLATFAGKNLGIYVVRPVRGGKAPSTHGAGAALDYAYRDRGELEARILPWLIGNSRELGISAIHDYAGDRIWHAGRTSDTRDAFTKWWKKQNGRGSDFGDTSARWIHIETHPDRWADSTPIEARIKGLPTPTAPTPGKPSPTKPSPGPNDWTDRIVQNLPTLKQGSKGGHVKIAQRLLDVDDDGTFGPGTTAAVKALQTARKLGPDGIVGPKTWQALLTPAP